MKKGVPFILIIIILLSCLTACGTDRYKEYRAANMQAIGFTQGDWNLIFKPNTVELITDYETYSSYGLHLDYTEAFFENNDLLVFIVTSCSSDQMEYVELREKDGLLYPLFERKKIGGNEPVTDDFILQSYCVELSKEFEYQAGEIIYHYK